MAEKKKKDDDIDKLIDDLKSGEMNEEDMQEFIDELTKKRKNKNSNFKVAYILGFLTHQNLAIHFLITLFLNVFITCGIQGFFRFIDYKSIVMLFVGIGIFTVFEFILKFLIVRYFMRIVVYTVGIVFLAAQILIFIGMDLWLYGFRFESEVKGALFILLFSLARYIVTRYVRELIAYFQVRKGRS